MNQEYCDEILECIDKYHNFKHEILNIKVCIDPKDYSKYKQSFDNFEKSKRELKAVLKFRIGEDFFKDTI